MPLTARCQAASHQSEDAASKDSMPLAASERRSAAAATWWHLVWAAAGHESSCNAAGLLLPA